jgi:hypothetical protein
MSASHQQGFQPYVFDAIYSVTGKPTHTRQRLASIRFEHSSLLDSKAVLAELFGKKITVTLEPSKKFRQLHFSDSDGIHSSAQRSTYTWRHGSS